MERPASAAEAAALLREAAEAGRSVGIRGGGTKLTWGGARRPDTWVSTAGLARIREHNAGDLTAVVEAGVRLADAQRAFAAEGQMLALDPPLGAGDAATVGGVFAAADAGPLRHRYGAARDLVLGVTLALTDGTVAKAGGRVIKNVAGYDLGKLFAGSRGTLGLVAEIVVRLHPLPAQARTVVARGDDPGGLGRAAVALAARPLELDAFDVRWEGASGALLLRVAGVAAHSRAAEVAQAADGARLETEVVEDDEPLWAEQRSRQRSGERAILRVAALPSGLERVLRLADRLGGSVAGRAGLGVLWVALPPEAGVLEEARRELRPWPTVLLDAPEELRAPWEPANPALRALEARVRARFDPEGVLAA
jgi:glycolate dehydrogenase FAD-binding subunit